MRPMAGDMSGARHRAPAGRHAEAKAIGRCPAWALTIEEILVISAGPTSGTPSGA